MLTQLNRLRDEIHANAKAKGFYDETHPDEHYLMLIICEIAEAVEADRKGHRAHIHYYENAIYNGFNQIRAYNYYIKGTLEEEIADIAIRLLDFAGHKEVDLQIDDEAYYQQIFAAIQSHPKISENTTLTAFLFMISQMLAEFAKPADEIKDELICYLYILTIIAERHNFDLLYHVEQKMQYNASRPYKHGKAY